VHSLFHSLFLRSLPVLFQNECTLFQCSFKMSAFIVSLFLISAKWEFKQTFFYAEFLRVWKTKISECLLLTETYKFIFHTTFYINKLFIKRIWDLRLSLIWLNPQKIKHRSFYTPQKLNEWRSYFTPKKWLRLRVPLNWVLSWIRCLTVIIPNNNWRCAN